MTGVQLVFVAAPLFLCFWTAVLARFKGYSATCWFLGGGVVGVVILSLLPSVTPDEAPTKLRGNRIGILVSTITLSALWLAWYCVNRFCSRSGA